ncbi:MAG: shikimate kinase [Alphaproteobacteria bacterium]|nr:MAG: shikimate kinase [Alphaproteobacteria bacterium]
MTQQPAIDTDDSRSPDGETSPNGGEGAAGAQVKRSIVLVGMMGVGKTTVGRRLARRLGLPFVDADEEIERAAGMPIADIFEELGEQAFRDGERRVVARLLDEGVRVISLGGGAFLASETREAVRRRAVSVWLDAPLDILVERTARRRTRPLLEGGDRHEILARLMEERRPFYAEADIRVESGRGPHDRVVRAILTRLRERGVVAQ